MKDVVGVAAPYPRDRALIAEQGVDPPTVRGMADEIGELLGEGLWPEAGQRPVVARGKHPPARLSLSAVLLDEDRRASLEDKPDHRPLGARALGRVLHVHAPSLREMHQQ